MRKYVSSIKNLISCSFKINSKKCKFYQSPSKYFQNPAWLNNILSESETKNYLTKTEIKHKIIAAINLNENTVKDDFVMIITPFTKNCHPFYLFRSS